MPWKKSFKEFCDFSPNAYRNEIADYDRDQLRELHKTIQQKVVGALSGAGISAATILGGPIGVVGIGISARRVDVNKQRLRIIENRLDQKGWPGYEMRKRDFIKPIAITGAAAAFAPGAESFVGHMAPHAASHAAATIQAATSSTAHHGITALHQTIQHPETFVKAIEHGASAQLSEAGSHIAHHTIRHAAHEATFTTLSTHNADAVGYAAGEYLAKFGETKAIEKATEEITTYAYKKAFEAKKPSLLESKVAAVATYFNIASVKTKVNGTIVSVTEVDDDTDKLFESGTAAGISVSQSHKIDINGVTNMLNRIEYLGFVVCELDYGFYCKSMAKILLVIAVAILLYSCDTLLIWHTLVLYFALGSMLRLIWDDFNNYSDKRPISRRAMLRKLRIGGEDIEKPDKHGWTLLHHAAYQGYVDVINLLLKKGAKDWAENSVEKYKPLHLAAMNGKDQAISTLVQNGSTIDCRSEDGKTPLQLAATTDHANVLETLLRLGANINQTTWDPWWAALHLAASSSKPKNIKILLSNGANSKVGTRTNIYPIHCASNSPEVTGLLLDALPSAHELRTTEGETPLMRAVSANSRKVIATLLAKGADPSLDDKKGWSPLHIAVSSQPYSDTRTIKMLLRAGGDVNIGNGSKHGTALMVACSKDNIPHVKILLAAKNIKLDATDSRDRTALCIAAMHAGPEVIRLLLKKKPSAATHKDHHSQTPLHHAVESGKVANVAAILRYAYETHPEMKDGDGRTPIELAKGPTKDKILLLFARRWKSVERGKPPAVAKGSKMRTIVICLMYLFLIWFIWGLLRSVDEGSTDDLQDAAPVCIKGLMLDCASEPAAYRRRKVM